MTRIFVVVAVAVGACSSSSSSSSAPGPDASNDAPASDATSDAAKTPEPKNHRAAATDCPHDRVPGSPGSPRSTDKCAADTDCTAGQNGRCNSSLQGNVCSYDQCFADADCGSGSICTCRNDQLYGANVCYHGNCRTDADCAAGWCSPSGVNLYPSCTGLSPGSFGFFCHVPADECTNDADCKPPDTGCNFDPDKLHWRCYQLLCAGG